MGNKPPKICFVEALAYPVLSGDKRQSSTGGESVQHTLLARAFAELGWQVSMISRDVGQEDGTVVDGVQVWKTYVQKAGLPYIRFVHPRLTSIWRALRCGDQSMRDTSVYTLAITFKDATWTTPTWFASYTSAPTRPSPCWYTRGT
jgi:hypothetical protein